MHESSERIPYVGLDVGKNSVDACRRQSGGRRATRQFTNDPGGHRQLLAWLGAEPPAAEPPVRACMEASGRYGLDLALALFEAEGVEVMVANPRAVKNFRDASMRRSKTDALDAAVLCEYARRMPFEAWEPPEEAARELRAITRRVQALTVERSREKNRLHAAQASRTASPVVVNDIGVNLRHLDRRIAELIRQARKLIEASDSLRGPFERLTSIRGVGEKSAVLLLGELAMLPEDMGVRQWVAYAGLDPRRHQSGSSVEMRERISKVGNARIRRALYMPALVAIRHEPHVGAFYDKLTGKGKKPIVAVVAVMRKLLHSIYGMLKHSADFDGEKFYRTPEKATLTA